MTRLPDLERFYDILARLDARLGGKRTLVACDGRMGWPERGVYFFFEDGEMRSDSGRGLRVVRVGTHALIAKSRTTLWKRLSQHRGVAATGAGNHRGSIFRLIAGTAIKRRDGTDEPRSWGVAGDPGKAARQFGMRREQVKETEHALELEVSRHLRAMPFLWVAVDDPPGPVSQRGRVERNAIRLLSNYRKPVLDNPSANWLGRHSDRERVRNSGLWNNNHVDEDYDPSFLDALAALVESIPPP